MYITLMLKSYCQIIDTKLMKINLLESSNHTGPIPSTRLVQHCVFSDFVLRCCVDKFPNSKNSIKCKYDWVKNMKCFIHNILFIGITRVYVAWGKKQQWHTFSFYWNSCKKVYRLKIWAAQVINRKKVTNMLLSFMS